MFVLYGLRIRTADGHTAHLYIQHITYAHKCVRCKYSVHKIHDKCTWYFVAEMISPFPFLLIFNLNSLKAQTAMN